MTYHRNIDSVELKMVLYVGCNDGQTVLYNRYNIIHNSIILGQCSVYAYQNVIIAELSYRC